ncbi:MAG: hypothetical protein H0T73_08005, partial [Ardenticatenales bacterium]|nr:hypothetical protein [Ardenticatenales bacterium]
MAARHTIPLLLALLLMVAFQPLPVGAVPPLPPEAATLSEDEQWLLWQSRASHPPVKPAGEWISQELPHFRFFFLPGSAAERDWPLIAQEAEQSLQRVLKRLNMSYEEQLDVYLVERVFWQGGAAYGGGEVLI